MSWPCLEILNLHVYFTHLQSNKVDDHYIPQSLSILVKSSVSSKCAMTSQTLEIVKPAVGLIETPVLTVNKKHFAL